MFLRRLSWAQLTRSGVPPLFVLRPVRGGFTPPNVGDEYPAPDPVEKFQMTRARQMYQQRRVGTHEELDVALAKSGFVSKPGAETKTAMPAKSRKERGNGRS